MSLICKNDYRFSIVKITSFYRKQRHILTIVLPILCVMNIAPILQEAFKYIYIVLLFNKYIISFFIYICTCMIMIKPYVFLKNVCFEHNLKSF